MPINWKVLSAFTGIFLAGAVTGGFVGVPLSHHFGPKPITTEQFGPQQMKKMTEQLDLTPAQREKLKPIFKQAGDDLKTTRKEAFKATTDIFERMESAISIELTDAQRVRFNEMQAQERERRKQWMLERAKQRGDMPLRGPSPGSSPMPPMPPGPQGPSGAPSVPASGPASATPAAS